MQRSKLLICILVVLFFSCQPKKREENKPQRAENNGMIEYTEGESVYWQEYEKAAELLAAQKIEEALDIYRWLHSKEPNRCSAFDGLGAAYSIDGNLDSTIFYYQKSLRLNPRCVISLLGLGSSYYRIGNDTAGILYYNKVIEMDPDIPDAYWGLALLYHMNKDKENARKNAAKFIQLAPESEHRSGMENILYENQ